MNDKTNLLSTGDKQTAWWETVAEWLVCGRTVNEDQGSIPTYHSRAAPKIVYQPEVQILLKEDQG